MDAMGVEGEGGKTEQQPLVGCGDVVGLPCGRIEGFACRLRWNQRRRAILRLQVDERLPFGHCQLPVGAGLVVDVDENHIAPASGLGFDGNHAAHAIYGRAYGYGGVKPDGTRCPHAPWQRHWREEAGRTVLARRVTIGAKLACSRFGRAQAEVNALRHRIARGGIAVEGCAPARGKRRVELVGTALLTPDPVRPLSRHAARSNTAAMP